MKIKNLTQTIKHKKSKFKTLRCAPRNNSKKLLGVSCYTDEDLNLMKKVWNENSSTKIDKDYPDEIWSFFKEKLDKKCQNELCWLKSKPLSANFNKELYFKSIFSQSALNLE